MAFTEEQLPSDFSILDILGPDYYTETDKKLGVLVHRNLRLIPRLARVSPAVTSQLTVKAEEGPLFNIASLQRSTGELVQLHKYPDWVPWWTENLMRQLIEESQQYCLTNYAAMQEQLEQLLQFCKGESLQTVAALEMSLNDNYLVRRYLVYPHKPKKTFVNPLFTFDCVPNPLPEHVETTYETMEKMSEM